MKTAIIVRGVEVPCAAPVRTWHETGLHFVRRLRTKPARFVVNHWTGSENAAPSVFQNMQNHRDDNGRPEPLSVHFIVDQMGEVYQCCDTEARCAHALERGGNAEGVGIEFINKGDSKKVSDHGFIRERRTDLIHGQMCTYGAMTAAQVAAALALNESICRAYSLPFAVPMKDGDVFPTVLPPGYLARYRGALGHLHLDYGKRDPGLDLMRAIHRHFAQLALS